MRKSIAIAAAAFLAGSITTGVLIAQAQPAGPGPMPPRGMGGPMAHGPGMGPGMGPADDRMGEHRAHRIEMMRAFALVHRAEDRKLTPPDAQKIAEAFLLWNGNHSWKVLNAKTEGDAIGFDLATAEGSVIAHFTMDPKTGRLARRA
ncbi:MAG: hypothetical protein EXR07_21625 [Acetobacteraceae bacterium]|nr:hypothetical protein [Acetobacteraceae bacterium]